MDLLEQRGLKCSIWHWEGKRIQDPTRRSFRPLVEHGVKCRRDFYSGLHGMRQILLSLDARIL